jgi:hypothetical protein
MGAEIGVAVDSFAIVEAADYGFIDVPDQDSRSGDECVIIVVGNPYTPGPV